MIKKLFHALLNYNLSLNFSSRMSATGRSYTQIFSKVQYIIIQVILSRKSMKNLQLPTKKYSVSIRLLTVKNNSHMDLKTSHAQLSEKGCQYREEDYENKSLS